MTADAQTYRQDIRHLYSELIATSFDPAWTGIHSEIQRSTVVRETLIRLVLKTIVNEGNSHQEDEDCTDETLELPFWSAFWNAQALQSASLAVRQRFNLHALPLASQLEQAGSIYEALLALSTHDGLNATTARDAPQVRRHREGAHYTPPELVIPIVQSTLEPLVRPGNNSLSPQSILKLKICDPAMGCGAFLIRSALKLASDLGSSWAAYGLPENVSPSSAKRFARRLVIEHCLYGVDKNHGSVVITRLILGILGHVDGLPGLRLEQQLKQGDALFGMRHHALRPIVANNWARGHIATNMMPQINQSTFMHTVNALSQSSKVDANHQPSQTEFNDHEAPFHWHIEFPTIFTGSTPGFNAFVGNPPFGSMIDSASTEPHRVRVWWRFIAPEVAVGTFDKSSLFLQLAIELLVTNGRYGFFLPRSVLSAGTSASALQSYVNQNAAPCGFYLFKNTRLFEGANVFVCGIIGAKSAPSSTLNVYDAHTDRTARQIPRTSENWWHMLCSNQVGHQNDSLASADMVPLSHLFTVSAGCATGVAYDLSPHVIDNEDAEGLKLITTGLIDRFTFNWGLQPARFLKQKYDFPRWPQHHPSAAIGRASSRQERSKLLVGGLTKTLEAAFDEDGKMGGVVSTWAIFERTETADSMELLLLEMLLNSWIVTWIYHTHHGAQQSPWGGMTIKKAALLDLHLPRALFTPRHNKSDTENPGNDAVKPVMRLTTICDQLKAIAHGLHADRKRGAMASVYAADREAQPLFAELYGISLVEFEIISSWYQKRARRNPPMRIYSDDRTTDSASRAL